MLFDGPQLKSAFGFFTAVLIPEPPSAEPRKRGANQ